jgi:predicted PurR-regulated permease PerM
MARIRQDLTDSRAEAAKSSSLLATLCRVAKIVAYLAVGSLLYVAHAAIVPVALAVLFALVLSGPVETFHKRGVPRNLSALLIIVLAIGMLAGVAALTWTPGREWLSKAPETMKVLRQKVNPIARAMSRIDDFRNEAGVFDAKAHNGASPPSAVGSESAPAMILDIGGSALASLLTVVVVTTFLLAGGPPMMARMTAAFVDNMNLSHVQILIEQIRREVGHFYLVTAFINLGLGIATGLAMWAWGMPTPYLWGALAGVLNFIPYVGAVTTLGVISLVAVVSFDSLSQVVGVMGTYVAMSTIEGQIVQPLLVGHRLEVNPLLIFLGLWFGGIFWGIPGILLATPTLVALKVVAENSEHGQSLMQFLGRNASTKDPGVRQGRDTGAAIA